MPGTLTDPRIVADTALGINWQSAEDAALPTPPFTPEQFIVAQNISRDPDPSYIQPDGTHGSMHRRVEGTRIVTQSFKKELQIFASRHQLLPFIESAMSALPVSNDADVTESGDTAGVGSLYTLTGIRPYHNASPFQINPVLASRIFIDLIEVGGPSSGFPVDIKVYKDAALTQQVSEVLGVAAPGVVTATPVNDSFLTVSFTLSGAATQTITLTIDKINYSFENQYTRFFRLFYTDGQEVVVLSDCAVGSINFESAESGELIATVSVMAKRRNPFAGESLTVPGNNIDLITYSHSELSVTKNPLVPGITPVLDSFSFQIENNMLQNIGNNPSPQKLIKRGFTNIGGSMAGHMSDEFAELIADARSNTDAGGGIIDMRADYLLLGNTLRLEMKNARIRLSEPGFAGEEIEAPSLDYEAHADEVDDPVAVSVEL